MSRETGVSRVSVNPARAGMIPAQDAGVVGGVGKPRASGDDPAEDPPAALGQG